MNKALSFLLNNFMRSFAVAGYSFFGLIVATQDIKLCCLSSAIAGGSYFFTELMRYYKINPSTKKAKIFKFLIFS